MSGKAVGGRDSLARGMSKPSRGGAVVILDYIWRATRKLTGRGLAGHTIEPEVAADRLGADAGAYAHLFFRHEGRTVHKWTQYFAAYDAEFGPYRDGFRVRRGGECRPLRFLEIGVQHGGSLQLWRKYFGPEAVIYGIDVDPRCAIINDPDLNVRIGSQDDPGFLRSVVTEMGGVDIVLDDGSHVAKHQRASFEILFPLVSDGGLYAVEDTHTSYWRDFGGGYRSARSFLGVTKRLIDDMHTPYHGRAEGLGAEASAWVPRLSVYDSMVFVHKRRRAEPMVTKKGIPSF
jgi:hypothetical protein